MNVIPFPSLTLTYDDEASIVGSIIFDGNYLWRRETNVHGHPVLTLLGKDKIVRGYVTKHHGKYTILAADGSTVTQSIALDEILEALTA